MNATTLVASFFSMCLLCACISNPETSIEQRVDEQSGESFTQPREPLRMVATRPALSRVGKDYLFVSPVFVSGSGMPQNYLWFSIGSTTDREITGAIRPGINSIVLILDGMPMTFDLVPWQEIASSRPFDPGVKHHASFGAKVTRSQLQRLSAASELSAFVTNEDDRSPQYLLAAGQNAIWSDL